MLSARWWTLVVWALAAAGALLWGLKLFAKAPVAPPHTQLADAGAAARGGDLTRLLGADALPETAAQAVEPAADARFQLIGVVSPRSPQAAREGVALIAVDGKPPRAYRVGAVIDGQNVLQSVNARGATLGPRNGAAVVALNLAPPAPAATGVPAPYVPGMAPATPPAPPFPRFAQPPQQQPMPQPPPVLPMPNRRLQPQAAPADVDPTPPAGVMPTRPGDPAQTR